MSLCYLKDTSKTTDVDMDNLVANTNHNPEASEVEQNTDKEDLSHIVTMLKGITFVDSPLIFIVKNTLIFAVKNNLIFTIKNNLILFFKKILGAIFFF